MKSKAWDILNDEEKAALSLSTNHSKSTWEAGEILNKSHYKYLEIQARSRHFFVMFTEYFKKTNDLLIPENSDISWDFREFIKCVIEERMGYRQTLKIIGKESKLCSKSATTRNTALTEYMENLLKHKDPLHRDLYHIIREFDRWNNFRILPVNIQEPSAFNRRNKTKVLKHLKNLYEMDRVIIDIIKNPKLRPKTDDCYYLPIVCRNNDNNDYEIIKLSKNAEIIKHLSKELNLYIFDDFEIADDYGFLLEQYLIKKNKTCKIGQIFWPKYRTLTQKAINYNDVNNIHPKRVNHIKDAFENFDNIVLKKKEAKMMEKIKNSGEGRVDSDKFWS